MLSISTSEQVLRRPFAGRNHWEIHVSLREVVLKNQIKLNKSEIFKILKFLKTTWKLKRISKSEFKKRSQNSNIWVNKLINSFIHLFLHLRVTPKRWYAPFIIYFCVILSILWLKKTRKVVLATKNDFDQRTACRAPVPWLKYTTVWFFKCVGI